MKDEPLLVRELSSAEREIASRLLLTEFTGAAELREQAKDATVRAEDHGGVLVLVFNADRATHPAGVNNRIPVEADGLDSDGVPIHVLVHVVGGLLREVEIFREDSRPILRLPDPKSLSVQVNDA